MARGSEYIFFFSSRRRHTRFDCDWSSDVCSSDLEDVELGQIGEIKKSKALVMRVETGEPIGYEWLRWRGIALAKFDGKRWSSGAVRPQRLEPGGDGWIRSPQTAKNENTLGQTVRYTV